MIYCISISLVHEQLNNFTVVIKDAFPQATSNSKPEVNYFVSLSCTMLASVKQAYIAEASNLMNTCSCRLLFLPGPL